jgi:hypothetical protein
MGLQLRKLYGSSRPWFLLVVVLLAVLALSVGTQVNEAEKLWGWQNTLKAPDYSAELLRAGIYAVQSIFNPLNLITPKPLVMISDRAGALVGGFLGIIGIVAFALFLLSLRRRFKLE